MGSAHISRYEYRTHGVWDRDRGMLVLPSDTEWSHYVAYVREGGQVDAVPRDVNLARERLSRGD